MVSIIISNVIDSEITLCVNGIFRKVSGMIEQWYPSLIRHPPTLARQVKIMIESRKVKRSLSNRIYIEKKTYM